MSDVHTLLSRCQELGATFAPGPDGKLKVKAPAPLPEELREALRQRRPEILALLSQQLPFPCPSCGGLVGREPADEHVPTRFWTCSRCGTWGATRDGAASPVVWVGNAAKQ